MSKELPTSNPVVLPCPFCGSPAMEGPLWPRHYGCSNDDCGASKANLSTDQWNRRPPPDTEVKRLRALNLALFNANKSLADMALLLEQKAAPADETSGGT